MSKKNDLGKGIRALISNIETKGGDGNRLAKPTSGASNIENISLDKIETNPYQPRNVFDEQALQELSDSIKSHGLIQPITCRKLSANKYQLISGERRFRASKMAGLKNIPTYIRKANDQEMVEMALLENIQRSDLNAIEIAISYQRLMDEFNLTHVQMADRVSKKRSTISNYLRLLKLPPSIQDSLKKELISMGHARVLAGIDSKIDQLDIHAEILNQQLSVRATETLAKANRAEVYEEPKARASANPFIVDVEKRLRSHLGSKVSLLQGASGKGKLTIPFSSTDQLNDILDSILDD